MLLALDIGNTTVGLAVYDGAERVASFRVLSDRTRTSDEWDVLLTTLLARRKIAWESLTRASCCSVVPQIQGPLCEAVAQRTGGRPRLITAQMPLGLDVRYDTATLGADRLTNAMGAFARYPHRDCVVIDFGTATKLEAVLAGGVYLGGAILPGIEISCDALFARAAKLSQVELTRPPSVIGNNTGDALRAGILHGYGAQADGLVARFRDAMGRPNAHVIATGGLAERIAPYAHTLTDVQPFWTLDSVRLVDERLEGR